MQTHLLMAYIYDLKLSVYALTLYVLYLGSNCEPLSDPDNGRVHQFPDGITAVFTCKNGFTTVGESILHCVNGKWSSSPPKCVQP